MILFGIKYKQSILLVNIVVKVLLLESINGVYNYKIVYQINYFAKKVWEMIVQINCAILVFKRYGKVCACLANKPVYVLRKWPFYSIHVQ